MSGIPFLFVYYVDFFFFVCCGLGCHFPVLVTSVRCHDHPAKHYIKGGRHPLRSDSSCILATPVFAYLQGTTS